MLKCHLLKRAHLISLLMAVCLIQTAHAQHNTARLNTLSPETSLSELKGTSFTVRNSLLGVITVRIDKLKKLSRSIIIDSKNSGTSQIALGEGIVTLSRGLEINSSARKVRASISSTVGSEKNPYLRIRFTQQRNQGRVFEITHNLKSNTTKVRNVNLRALSGRSCALAGSSIGNEFESSVTRSAATASSLKVFTVATDCDYECYKALGASSANNRIAEFFNSANGYYRNDLAIEFKISSQTVRTSSSVYLPSLLDANALLDRFTSLASSLPKADLKHLITSKAIKEDIVGLSYLGQVCKAPNYSLGFSEHFNSLLTPIIIAHELGHNFGANHDPAPPSQQGIMTEYLEQPYPSAFSTLSKSVINSYINSLGSKACYDTSGNTGDGGSGGTSPVVSYNPGLSAKFSRSTFSATISQENGSNCSVEMHVAAKESGLFKTNSLLLQRSVSAQGSSKVRIQDLKKVLLKNSGKQAMPYVALKSVCSEGTGYSSVRRINVGIVNSRSVNKDKTLRNLKLWIADLKSKSAS